MATIRYLLWFLPAFALLGGLAPLLYFLLLGLLGASVVIGILGLLPWCRDAGRWDTLREAVWMFVDLLPILVLLRALIVLIYPLFPPVMELLNAAHAPLLQHYGGTALAQADRLAALVAALLVIVLTLYDAVWRLGQMRNLALLPFSKARSAHVGLVKLRGVARPLRAGQTTLLRFDAAEGGKRRAGSVLFQLEDDSGRVLVDPRGARFSDDLGRGAERAGYGEYLGPVTAARSNRVCEVVLPRHAKGRGGEHRLQAGDPITLLGIAHPIGTRLGQRLGLSADTLIVTPRRGLFADRYHDVFILSNGDDQPLRGYFLGGLLHSGLFALFCLLLFAGLAWKGHVGLSDFERAYGYAPKPPAARHAAPPRAPPPLLERTIATPQTGGEVTVRELLERLHSAAPGNVIHYLAYLDRLGARQPAAAELLRIVRDSDDPQRVRIARRQLHDWQVPVPVEAPPTPALRERRVTVGASGERVSVGQMLERLAHAPVDEVRRYLYYLEALGARDLAAEELRAIAAQNGEPQRTNLARAWLQRWEGAQ